MAPLFSFPLFSNLGPEDGVNRYGLRFFIFLFFKFTETNTCLRGVLGPVSGYLAWCEILEWQNVFVFVASLQTDIRNTFKFQHDHGSNSVVYVHSVLPIFRLPLLPNPLTSFLG